MAQARTRASEAEAAAAPETQGAREAAATSDAPPAPKPRSSARVAQAPAEPVRDIAPAPEATRRPRGRPRGKRSDPEFEQITAYLSRQTYRDTKIALLQEGRRREFSQLVEELLQQWLDKQK